MSLTNLTLVEGLHLLSIPRVVQRGLYAPRRSPPQVSDFGGRADHLTDPAHRPLSWSNAQMPFGTVTLNDGHEVRAFRDLEITY